MLNHLCLSCLFDKSDISSQTHAFLLRSQHLVCLFVVMRRCARARFLVLYRQWNNYNILCIKSQHSLPVLGAIRKRYKSALGTENRYHRARPSLVLLLTMARVAVELCLLLFLCGSALALNTIDTFKPIARLSPVRGVDTDQFGFSVAAHKLRSDVTGFADTLANTV